MKKELDINKLKQLISSFHVIHDNKSNLYDAVSVAYATGILQGLLCYVDE